MALSRFAFGSLAMLLSAPAAAQVAPDAAVLPGHLLTERELAEATGRFFLPSGVELALTITSDTLLNGQPVLRTVLAVDQGSTLSVFGRAPGTQSGTDSAAAVQRSASPSTPTGIAVEFDRHSGIQTITPTFSAVQQGAVTIGGNVASPEAAGLERLSVTPGGPAVQTPDGMVSVRTLANGSLVTLAGDQLQASNLVGQSVATAIINSGNDRTFDTVTNVAIDLRNISPYQVGAAALRADALALDATRGMIR